MNPDISLLILIFLTFYNQSWPFLVNPDHSGTILTIVDKS